MDDTKHVNPIDENLSTSGRSDEAERAHTSSKKGSYVPNIRPDPIARRCLNGG